VPVDCASREPVGAEEPTVTPGGGITYMASTDTYLYEWKTSKEWTDCRRLILTLADGTPTPCRLPVQMSIQMSRGMMESSHSNNRTRLLSFILVASTHTPRTVWIVHED
jgi:hypothetical protein